VNAWKEALFIEAKRHKPFEPLAGAVRCKIVFTFRRPKSHFTSKGLLRDDAPFHRKSKPDLDNLAKAVMDVLTQVGYWRDDAQIVELSLMKMYATEYAECQEYPGAYIEVETVCDWDEK
jgi:Holliday junction resolvase RusA-like endonuclease